MDNAGNYWTQVWRKRISRRQALQGGAMAGAALAASGLIGCTGSSKPPQQIEVSEAQDTSSRATPGGIFKDQVNFDVTTMDVLATTSFTAQYLAAWTCSRIVKFKPGIGKGADGSVEGDAAESWEMPDPLTLVFKMRPNIKWDPRPPTNARVMDAEDIAFSWEKFKSVSINRTDLVNSLNPYAPVESMTARDKQTVVVKLAKPNSSILSLLASNAHLWLMPKESDGGFDPKTVLRGSGPWLLDEYTPNVVFKFKKNPNWYVSGRPFVDAWERPIITEPAQLRAQFAAKNVWRYNNPDDILDVKRDIAQAVVGKFSKEVRNNSIIYGYNPGSPFRDKRVRQAVSMSIDRDAFTDTFYDIKRFKEAGIDRNPGWASAITPGWGPLWLDPKGSDFGANAKYFKYDPQGAKKLLAEAGYPNGFDTEFVFIPTTEYNREFPKMAQVLIEMVTAVGIRAKPKPVDYRTEWLPKYHQVRGMFDGLALHPHGEHADCTVWLFLFHHSKGGRSHVAEGIDPETDKRIDDLFAEYNVDKRKAMYHDLQRYMADTQIVTPAGGIPDVIELAYPWVQNFDAFQRWPGSGYGWPIEMYVNWWIDKSKMTS